MSLSDQICDRFPEPVDKKCGTCGRSPCDCAWLTFYNRINDEYYRTRRQRKSGHYQSFSDFLLEKLWEKEQPDEEA